MKPAELFNAIVEQDRLMTCEHGCGNFQPELGEWWTVDDGTPELHIRAWCPLCHRPIRDAEQIRKGSLEEVPW